jgi:cyclohexanecarboxylate-CoA ligase
MHQTRSLKAETSSYIPFLSTADLCDLNSHRFPEKEALVDRRSRLTWREVRILSNKLALCLREMELSRVRPLLVQLPNCVELFLTRLACEKAGVACVTVSPHFKTAELKQILMHTKPAAAIIPRPYRKVDFHSLIQNADYSNGLEFLVVGDDVPQGAISVDKVFRETIDSESAEWILNERRLGPLDSCQIATTSGSTGAPKCVEVLIYARLLTASIHARRFKLDRCDTIAPLAPIISGTAEALGYFGSALLGARVVLIDHFDPDEALHWIVAEGVTFACLVPTMMAKLAGGVEMLKRGSTRLKGIVTYGSLLPVAVAQQIEQLVGVKIVQAYGTMDYGGITATSIDDKANVRIATVGRPLEGNEVIICGDKGEPLPAGEIGHIKVRGLHCVGRYYRAPGLDARKWTDGYFDIGELGQFDESGNLIVIGRTDHVIIRGGQNIYPEDIENFLGRHPSIEEAVVVGIPDPMYGERVCAFISVKPSHKISSHEVTEFLRKEGLAHFKLPEFIEIMPELPKVPTGQKVNRKELARIAKDQFQTSQDSISQDRKGGW